MCRYTDLKFAGPKGLWGFKSSSRHHHYAGQLILGFLIESLCSRIVPPRFSKILMGLDGGEHPGQGHRPSRQH